MQHLLDLLKTNAFASGGMLVMAVGAIAVYLRQIPGKILNIVTRRVILTMEVDNSNPCYEWIEDWLNNHPRMAKVKNTRIAVYNSRVSPPDSAYSSSGGIKSQSTLTPLVPNVGEYTLMLNRKLCWVSITAKDPPAGATLSGYKVRTIIFRILGGTKADIFKIIEEARAKFNTPEDESIRFLHRDGWNWSTAFRRKVRPSSSLVFDNGKYEEIKLDLETFLSKEDWYREMGIPWRRGYLLHGEPGNGKSSIIASLASDLKRDVCVLSLSDPSMDDFQLQMLLTHMPETAFVVLEDIDAIFEERTKKKEVENELTFTGLLNALDGLMCKEGRILFMTTNRKEILDQALIRPGRADKHMYIGNATQNQAKKFFLRFFPSEEQSADLFVSKIENGKRSMASLQEHILKHINSAKEAAQTLGV